MKLTFHLRNCARKNFLLGLWFLERSQNFVDDGFCQISLLALLQVLFVSHPAVENGLDLVCDGDLLLRDKVGGFKLSRLLKSFKLGQQL